MLMISRCLFSFLSIASAVTASSLPPEVFSFTGLTADQINALVNVETSHALGARADTCPVNITTGGVFPGPSNPTLLGIAQRNAFVERCSFNFLNKWMLTWVQNRIALVFTW